VTDSLEQRAAEPDPSGDWSEKWCEATVGMSRSALHALMGEPTQPDSGKIPLIALGGPPEPLGADTWEAPGSYQFNAFYNRDLNVQQLDVNGPDNTIICDTIRF